MKIYERRLSASRCLLSSLLLCCVGSWKRGDNGPCGSSRILVGITKDDALIIVDLQNDFVPPNSFGVPGCGSFGVAEGDSTCGPITKLIERAVEVGATVVATRDYHPINHCSFNTASDPGPFPPHCIQVCCGGRLTTMSNSVTTMHKKMCLAPLGDDEVGILARMFIIHYHTNKIQISFLILKGKGNVLPTSCCRVRRGRTWCLPSKQL